MKRLALIGMTLALAIVFTVSAFIGMAVGFEPLTFGAVAVVLTLLVKKPKGSFAAGLDVSEVASQLNEYIHTGYNLRDIWKRAMQQLEFEQYMFKKSGVRGKFSFLNSSSTEVLQPWQKAWTPKGAVAFTPYINEAFHQKIDFTIDNIDEIFDGYLNFMGDETLLRKDWPLVRYIMEQHIMPQVIEELNIQSAQGVHDAPTPGTAGASIDGANGILTIVENEITATNLDEIVTGAITVSNAVEKTELFLVSIDDKVLKNCKQLFMNKTNARFYHKNYRALFGSTNDPMSKGNLKLDYYDIEVVGLDAFAGKNRIMTTPVGNMVVGYDKIYTPNSMDVQQDKRVVNLLADFVRGYGFKTLAEVYVNDQE